MAKKKRIRLKPRFYIILFLFTALISVSIFFAVKGNISIMDIKKKMYVGENYEYKNYMVFTDTKIFLIYPGKFSIEVPLSVNINKDENIEILAGKGEFKKAMVLFNSILPEKIEKYYADDGYKISEETEEVPTYENDGKLYIDNVELDSLFKDKYYKRNRKEMERFAVDIISGQGDAANIGNLAKLLEKKYNIIPNVGDSGEESGYTYIKANPELMPVMKKIVMDLKSRYIRIYNKDDLAPLADGFILVGTDKVNDLAIELKTWKKEDRLGASILRGKGYENIKLIITGNKIEENKVICNPADYFTAAKIAKALDIRKIEETADIADKIEINIIN